METAPTRSMRAAVSAPRPVANLRLSLWKIEPRSGTGNRGNGDYDVNEKVRHVHSFRTSLPAGLQIY